MINNINYYYYCINVTISVFDILALSIRRGQGRSIFLSPSNRGVLVRHKTIF